MRSKLFKMAWAIKDSFATFGQALKAAWRNIRLIQAMKAAPQYFTYKKVDGSLRRAYGRLFDVPATKGGISSAGVVVYYDIAAEGWRSFKADSLVEDVWHDIIVRLDALKWGLNDY